MTGKVERKFLRGERGYGRCVFHPHFRSYLVWRWRWPFIHAECIKCEQGADDE